MPQMQCRARSRRCRSARALSGLRRCFTCSSAVATATPSRTIARYGHSGKQTSDGGTVAQRLLSNHRGNSCWLLIRGLGSSPGRGAIQVQNRAPMQRWIDGFDAPGHLPFVPRESSVVSEGPPCYSNGARKVSAKSVQLTFCQRKKSTNSRWADRSSKHANDT